MVEQRWWRGVFANIDTRCRMAIECPNRAPGDFEALNRLQLYELQDFLNGQILPVLALAHGVNQGVEIDPAGSVDLEAEVRRTMTQSEREYPGEAVLTISIHELVL